MRQIQILIRDGCDELDAIAPFEILAGGGLAIELVTLVQTECVGMAHGLTVGVNGVLGPAPDLLVVPGGGWITRAPRGAWAEAQDGVLPAAIAARHASGSILAGLCTGVMLIEAATAGARSSTRSIGRRIEIPPGDLSCYSVASTHSDGQPADENRARTGASPAAARSSVGSSGRSPEKRGSRSSIARVTGRRLCTVTVTTRPPGRRTRAISLRTFARSCGRRRCSR